MPNLRNIRYPGNASNLRFGTAISSSNQTSMDFTDIPSWVKRITVHISGISTDNTYPVLVRIGNAASGFLSTGYFSYTAWAGNVNQVTSRNETAGYNIDGTVTGATGWFRYGHVTITNITGSSWVFSHSIGFYSGAAYYMSSGGGGQAVSNLDRVQLISPHPTIVGSFSFFDGGVANISYEG